MNTGRKISLIYSGITIGLIIITGFVAYLCTSNYTQDIYYHYLGEKAHAVAEEKFSKDELDPIKYRNVVSRRKNSIPTSKEIFINVADRKKAESELSAYLDSTQIKRLFANQTIDFKTNNEVGTSFIYYDNTGTFVVLVLSRNPFIQDINNTLRWAILLLIAVSAFILYLFSRLYSMRALDRIDKDYQTEKMFVNNASHEINNPLTAIQGECEVALMCDHQKEEYKDILKRISQENDRIILIMKELLQFSHARNGKINDSSFQSFLISSILEKEKKAGITINLIHDFSIHTDKELLRIALHNLISNACKYSDGSPVIVTVDKKRILVEDRGIGIPLIEQNHIFEPFYRASNIGNVSGKGVGLALSKTILEKLGASIEVKSEEGKGTAFIVKFK